MERLKTVLWVLAAVAFVGFLDASFLAINHLRGVLPPCSIIKGCETVTTSVYSEVLGIPVALLGAIYYLAIICLAIYCLQTDNAKLIRVLRRATVIGLVSSVYFVVLQLFVIKAICIYCMISAGTSTALFVISLIYLKQHNHQQAL